MPSPVPPARGLTAKFIESLTPREKTYELPDSGCSGLCLRVTPHGYKVFRWSISSLGKVVTIGPWAMQERPAFVTLAQARGWLEKLKAARAAGVDQLNAVEAELRASLAPRPAAVTTAATGPTVKEMSDKFLRILEGQRKRPEEARRTMEIDILPVIGARHLQELKKSDCRALVERTVERGATVYAAKVLGLLKQFLSYCANVEDDFVSPAADLNGSFLGVESNIRDRWLTEEEIGKLWRALEQPEPSATPLEWSQPEAATCAALRLLLLTAVRSGELRQAKWADVDLKAKRWTIPVANMKLTPAQAKQAKPFVVPLSGPAVALFEEMQEIAGESAWVLASPAGDEDACYSEKSLGRAMRRLWLSHPTLKKLPQASPHDLRRTARTWLGRLGIAPHIAERCLNHSIGRIAKTYDHGDYFEERKAALEKWAAFIERVVEPKSSNVAFLPERTAG